MKKLLFFIFHFSPAIIFCQKNDYNWLNGYHRDFQSNFVISFNNFTPSIYPIDTKMDFHHTHCAVSNASGNPDNFVISNGCQIKFNGGDLTYVNNGDYWCDYDSIMNNAPGMFGLPMPGSNKIILFSYRSKFPSPFSIIGLNCFTQKLIYHIVDLGESSGEGQIIATDQVLLEGCLQRAAATRHANGRDWWILLPDNLQNKFYRWLLTPDGFQGPFIQEFDNPTIGSNTQYGLFNLSWTEFSSNGDRFIINDPDSVILLYNFDRCTGLLSNLVKLERDNPLNFAASFSPDGNLLYSINKNSSQLIQYDLLSADIPASKDTVAVWDGYLYGGIHTTVFGYMQHGPDGKIYIWAGDTHFMHVIEYPNKKGIACQVKQRAITLPSEVFAANLYYPNYRLGPIDGSSCDTLNINNHPMAVFRYSIEDTLSPLTVTFTDASSYEPTNWNWSFGDGGISQDTNPVHTFPGAGTYTVCLIVSNAYDADTLCREVTVGTVSGTSNLSAIPVVTVSPNPFHDELQVSMPAIINGVQPRFLLFDLFGREVGNFGLPAFNNTLQVNRLPAGLYVWQLAWNGKVTQVGKVVKIE